MQKELIFPVAAGSWGLAMCNREARIFSARKLKGGIMIGKAPPGKQKCNCILTTDWMNNIIACDLAMTPAATH
ncbi:MAG: hypothetical protein WC823_06610 [Parcubacteria group bacterium]